MDNERQKIYQLWSAHVGMSEEELEKEFQVILEEQKIEHPTDNEEIRLARTLMRQQAYHSKQFKGGGKLCDCIIIGAGTSYDPYKAERKEAVDKGFVNADGKPLFWSKRYEWKWKGANPGETKEVVIPSEKDDESCSRRVYAVVKVQDTENFKPAVIFLNGRKLCSTLPEFFTATKVKLGIKDDKINEDILSLNSTSSTKFQVVDVKPIDFPKMYEALLPRNYVPYEDLETIKSSDELPLGVIITSGIVTHINLTKEGVNSNAVEIMKVSKTIDDFSKVGEEVVNKTFWVPKDIPINFGEGSEIVLVAQKSTREKDGKDVENYNALGIYCIYSNAAKVELKPIVMQEVEEEEKEKDEIVTPTATWRGSGQ